MQSRLTTLLPKESFELKKFKSVVEPQPKFIKKKKRKNSDPPDFLQSMKEIGFEENEESDTECNNTPRKSELKNHEKEKQGEVKKIKWKRTK